MQVGFIFTEMSRRAGNPLMIHYCIVVHSLRTIGPYSQIES
jgi:hypothetical protein